MNSSTESDQKSGSRRVSNVKLGDILSRLFSLEELESLSFTLSFEFEELGEGGRSIKSIRLVKYFERTDRLLELAEAILELRPSLSWDELTINKGEEARQTPSDAAGAAPSQPDLAQPKLAIDETIRSLDYDPGRLLGGQADAQTDSEPIYERRVTSHAVLTCTKQDRSLSKSLNRITILRPSGGVIYPGALVYVDQELKYGWPTPIALNKGPITLTVDLPGLPDKAAQILDPSFSTVKAHLDGVLEKGHESPGAADYAGSARSSLLITAAYSPQQTVLDLDFSADWAGAALAAKLKSGNDEHKSVAMALYRQVFYTATMDTPSSPAAMFADYVSLEQVNQVIHEGAIPAYVRSVEYGRLLMIVMESTAVDTRANLESALEQALTGEYKRGTDENSRLSRIVRSATFTAIEVVGGTSKTTEFDGSQEGIEALRHFVDKDAGYRHDNPGAPISYSLAYLRDNMQLKLGFACDYIQAEYNRYPAGYVVLRHDGGYVGRFKVSWQEPDEKGAYVDQSWSSGNQSAGYRHQLDLPGDARAIKIHGQAATGLAWDPWGDAINITEDAPTNKTYRIYGSTLNRKSEVSSSST